MGNIYRPEWKDEDDSQTRLAVLDLLITTLLEHERELDRQIRRLSNIGKAKKNIDF